MAHAKTGKDNAFIVTERYERWQFFDNAGGGKAHEICRLCGALIRWSIYGGNALARSAHLRGHIFAGLLSRPLEVCREDRYRVERAVTPSDGITPTQAKRLAQRERVTNG